MVFIKVIAVIGMILIFTIIYWNIKVRKWKKEEDNKA